MKFELFRWQKRRSKCTKFPRPSQDFLGAELRGAYAFYRSETEPRSDEACKAKSRARGLNHTKPCLCSCKLCYCSRRQGTRAVHTVNGTPILMINWCPVPMCRVRANLASRKFAIFSLDRDINFYSYTCPSAND